MPAETSSSVRLVRDVGTGEAMRPRVRSEQTGDRAERRCLARAVRPINATTSPACTSSSTLNKHRDRPVTRAQIFDLEQRLPAGVLTVGPARSRRGPAEERLRYTTSGFGDDRRGLALGDDWHPDSRQ